MKKFLDGKVIVTVGDITKETTDAIVNAANSTLLGGGGVDGAIHRAGGVQILEECKILRKTRYPDGLPTGEAVATKAGKLKTKFVIHTVGPVWYNGKNNEEQLLQMAYLNSLKIAESLELKTIAFPAISTGVYGFPKDKAAKIVSQTLKNYFLNNNSEKIKLVKLVFFSEYDYRIFLEHQVF